MLTSDGNAEALGFRETGKDDRREEQCGYVEVAAMGPVWRCTLAKNHPPPCNQTHQDRRGDLRRIDDR